jgi:hypothetical protein
MAKFAARQSLERRASQSAYFGVLKDDFGLVTEWCHDHAYLALSIGPTPYRVAYHGNTLEIDIQFDNVTMNDDCNQVGLIEPPMDG